jgi:hypothetical protein
MAKITKKITKKVKLSRVEPPPPPAYADSWEERRQRFVPDSEGLIVKFPDGDIGTVQKDGSVLLADGSTKELDVKKEG